MKREKGECVRGYDLRLGYLIHSLGNCVRTVTKIENLVTEPSNVYSNMGELLGWSA